VRPKQGAGRGAPAEDVRIVLLEAAHAREPRQRAAELVAVQHAKVREPDGQLAVRARAVRKHEAVPCRGALGGGRQRTDLLRYQRCRSQKRAAHISSVVSVVPGRHLSMLIMWHLRARSSRSRRGMGLRRQGCLACARRHAHSPTVTAAARQPTGPPARAAGGRVRVGGRGPRRGSSWA